MFFGYLCTPHTCPSGGIGRRDGLKIHYPLKMCRFESGPGHFFYWGSAPIMDREWSSGTDPSLNNTGSGPDFGKCLALPGGDILGRKFPHLETPPAPDRCPGHPPDPGGEQIRLKRPHLAAHRCLDKLSAGSGEGKFSSPDSAKCPYLAKQGYIFCVIFHIKFCGNKKTAYICSPKPVAAGRLRK